MSTNIEIEVGDIVHVNFNGAQVTLCRRAKVLRKPQATGDSWQLCDADNSKIYYVSEGCTVMLLEKGTS